MFLPDKTDASAYHARVGFRLWTFLGLGVPTDFPRWSLTLQPTTNIPPPRHGRRLCISCTRRFLSLDLALARSIFQTSGTAFFPVAERSKSSQHEFDCSSLRAAMVVAMARVRRCRRDGAVAQWHGREAVGAMAKWHRRNGAGAMV